MESEDGVVVEERPLKEIISSRKASPVK